MLVTVHDTKPYPAGHYRHVLKACECVEFNIFFLEISRTTHSLGACDIALLQRSISKTNARIIGAAEIHITLR